MHSYPKRSKENKLFGLNNILKNLTVQTHGAGSDGKAKLDKINSY